MAKRLFAWVLVLAMVLSLMPAITLGISAEEAKPGEHTGHEGWTEWTDNTELPTEEGKYYLSVDVELTAVWTVGKNIDLCLNGHTVTQKTAATRLATLTEGKKSTLSIYDCVGTGVMTGGTGATGSAFNVGRTTTLNWYGGKLTGNTNASTGCIYLQKATSAGSGGVFNMYGGEISGNKVQHGTIYGAGGDAGYVGTQINIYGGLFKNNEATKSGGVIYVTGRGKVHVENATMTGNKAGTGGSAIYGEGADHPIFLKNVEITGNIGTHTSTTGYSAAVYTAGAGSHITLSGKVNISGNTMGVAGIPDVVMNSSGSDVLFVNELSAGSKVTFKTNKVTAGAATEVIAVAEGGSQKGIFQSEWITYMDATGATKSLTYGKDGFYFVEGHYHGDQKFVAWEESTKLPDEDVDGVGYYLAKDVKIGAYSNANICNTSGGKVLHLCVNGKTISRNTTSNVKAFEIKDGSVYLSDCTTVYDEDGFFVSGGKISGFANVGSNGGNGSAMYIYNAASVVEIQGVEFANNAVQQSNLAYGGGAIQIRNGNTTPVKIIGCKFTGNSSTGGSGAISIRNASQLIVEKTIFTENTADTGGVFYMDAGTLVVKDSKIVNNTARNASVINVLGDTAQVTFINTEISGNKNTGDVGYGAINCANSKSKVTLEGRTVVYNNKNKNGDQANLFLQNYAGVVYDVSGLTAGAKVGVSMIAERITSGYLYFSTPMTANPGYCVSDDPAYQVELDSENRLALAEKSVTPPADTHTHKLCGDSACTEHNDTTFQKWEKTDSLPTSGNWYLADNVTLSAVTDVTGDLVLCLNGKTVTQTAKARVISMAEDVTLTVTDCAKAYEGDAYVGGKFVGGANDTGAAFFVKEGATFNLYAGRITGSRPAAASGATSGSAIFLRSYTKGGATFNMYGGEITDNGNASSWGGAIGNGSGNSKNEVFVNIYGGKIFGNTAGTGGAMRIENKATVTIAGGEIYGNTAKTGGAIYLSKNGPVLKLQGGNIHDNTATSAGGGVYVLEAAGNVTLSKNVTIDGNTLNGAKSNLHLAGEKTISVSGLTGGKVGLSKDAARVKDTVSTDAATEAQKAYFSSDNGDYSVYLKDGKLALGVEKIVTEHMHEICNEAGCADHGVVPFFKWEKTDSLPLTGNWYLASDVELSDAYYNDSTKVTGVLNLCLNGHTVTAMDGKRHLMVTKGAVLNLTDCGTTGALTGGSGTWGASINVNAGATMNLYGGKISGNECTATSGGIGAIYVQGAGAIFNMYGGEIAENKSMIGTIYTPDVADGAEKAQVNIYGGTICDNTVISGKNTSGSTIGGYGAAITANKNGLVNIYGGVIENNTGSRYGAIFVTGQGTVLTMTGGEIKGNAATNGAAVMMQTRSVFDFKGGTIENNTASGTGGAIYVSTNTDLNMTGGTITGNESKASGGAIYIYQARANLLGGSITGNKAAGDGGAVAGKGSESQPMGITLGGNVQITGNQTGDKLNNLFLADDQTVKVQKLDSTAKIGLSVNVTGRAISQTVDADYAAAFQPDNHKLTVTYKEQKLWIEKIPEVSDHYHCVCNGVKNDICDHSNQMWIKWGDDAEEQDALPTESGYYYLTQDITLAAQQKTSGSQNVYLCLNGKTVTAAAGDRHLTIAGGSVYTVTDCNEAEGSFVGGNRTYGGSVNINTKGTLNWFAGKITGNTAPESEGGAIYMQENGTEAPAIFNMYGGQISGNTAKFGGAIRAAGSNAANRVHSQVNIYGGTISDNQSSYRGGAIYANNYAEIKLLGGTITGNKSEGQGGAIRIGSGVVLTIDGGKLTNNETADYGGAVFATDSGTEVYLESGTISGNSATAGGGIMLQTRSKMTMNGGAISENEAGSSGGGGIYVSTSTFFYMNGGKITKNVSAAHAGGIYYLRSVGELNGGEISYNEAANQAGGVRISGATVDINAVTIKGNAANEGGAMYVNRASTGSGDTLKYYPSTVTINEGTLITGNKAPSNCGGMLIANKDVVVTMNGGEISKNQSKNGAGVMIWADATFVLKGGKITGHNVKGNGGGMYVSTSAIFKMEGGTITGNTAKNGGGAYFLRSDITLSGGSITGNVAKQEVKKTNGKETTSGGNGAGFYIAGAKVTMCGTSLTYNKTEKGNGGGFATARASYTKNGATVYANPVVTITGGTISNNTAYNAGGFLTQTGTVTYLRGGTITNNKSLKNGAGVYISTKSELIMTGGRIVNNNSEKSAGGVYFYRSKGTVTGGQINSNTSKADAANILVNGAEADVTIKNMKIYGGRGKTAGGMVFQGNGKIGGSGKLYVENCEFFDNKADGGSAGAVYVGGRCNPTFVNCKFFDNSCSTTGGAMRIEARSYGTFENCVFENNHSGKDGGGLWVTVATELTMTNCVFRENHSDMKGGGIGCFGNIDMTDCVIENNFAEGGGGGIYNHFNTASAGGFQPGLIMKNCKVQNNQTEGVGGGIWAHKSVKTKLYDTQITGNQAALEGGAIWVGEDIELNSTTITGNTSGGAGYAVYISDGEFDGHSYITSRNKISGDVIITDNEGGDLWMGPDITIVIGADGLGEKANIHVTLDSGVITNRIFGAYHYDGGNQVYTITHGDRSMTDPEYDASLAVAREEDQQEKNTDVLLYAGIGVIGLAAIAAVVLVLLKKKKAAKPAEKD